MGIVYDMGGGGGKEEQIFSLPGIDNHRERMSVAVTGSRALGTFTEESDLDVEVVCSESDCASIREALFAAKRAKSPTQEFYVLKDTDWRRYFGPKAGRPHFTLSSLELLRKQFAEYDDVTLWIWHTAKVLHDPSDQLGTVVRGFTGYPADVLVRKLKYRWLLAAYWPIDVFPRNHETREELVAAMAAISNGINDLCRFFFLADGGPFPYTEKLVRLCSETALGKRFVPYLSQVTDLALGNDEQQRGLWERLDMAAGMLCESDTYPVVGEIEEAGYEVLRRAGVDGAWVDADYNNIQELFNGELGVVP